MRVLYAYNKHRGHGGGGDYTANATLEAARLAGWDVEVYVRSSDESGDGLLGRLRAGASIIHAPGSVRRIGELIEAFRPDLVHIHEVFPLVSPWILPECSRRGVPVVCTCVDYRLTCPVVTHFYRGAPCDRCPSQGEHWAVLRNCRGNGAESVMAALYTALSRRLALFRGHVSHFVAPSEFTRSWLIRYGGVDPERISAIPVIVRAPEIPADAATGRYVAFAGRLTPEKGVQVFLDAAAISGLPFRIAVPALGRVTVSIPPGTDVVTTHNREELDDFYRCARLVAVPSLWFETFGLVGAEAMAHGIPIVASRLGAVAELIEDGIHGLHCEPGNSRELAAKVRRLWDDPLLCRRMGEAARRRAVCDWSAGRHIELTRAVYERALAAPVASCRRAWRIAV